MLIDYHTHVNFNAFKEDADDVIARAHSEDVALVLVGSQIDTSCRAVEMAERYGQGVYAAVGLHPIHLEERDVDEQEIHFVTREEVFDASAYGALVYHPKTVAIGETGIDFYHLDDAYKTPDERAHVVELQKQTFRAHCALADSADLPLIMHCRPSQENKEDAYETMLAILEDEIQKGGVRRRGAIHCFLGTQRIAERFIALGFYVGFTGIITFPNAGDVREVASALPLDRILVETDCPYLAPVPMRGKRNEPRYVRYVANEIAKVKGIPPEQVESATVANTMRLFTKIVINGSLK